MEIDEDETQTAQKGKPRSTTLEEDEEIALIALETLELSNEPPTAQKGKLRSTTLEEDEEMALIGLEILELSSEDEEEEGGCRMSSTVEALIRNSEVKREVRKLVASMEAQELPTADDYKTVSPFPLGSSEEDSVKRLQHFTDLTILSVRLIVEFAKKLLGFETLSREDQITALKACSSEMMILKTARRYDPKTDTIVFPNYQRYTRENYYSAHLGKLADDIFDFGGDLSSFDLDRTEYALLLAMLVFLERPGLLEPEKLSNAQYFFAAVLESYVAKYSPEGVERFQIFVWMVRKLRKLGKSSVEVFRSLKNQKMKVHHFLEEIWDLE